MRTDFRFLVFLVLVLAACGGGGADSQEMPPDTPADANGDDQDGSGDTGPADGIAALSDEFDDPASLSDWQRVFQVEQWGFDQLESIDVGASEPGALTMMPFSSSWYENWRGVLVFKEVSGDFVATTHVRVSNRADTGPPGTQYSLAGIMTRVPRTVTPATWTPGGENYVFLSAGAADTPDAWQTEVKTTADSTSTLEIESGGPEVTLRTARIGPHVIVLLRWPGQEWQVHRRYRRDDFPATLQVGFTTYTDWPTCQAAGVVTHNTTLLAGTPDLIARFSYMRFAEPAVPPTLLGADFSNPAAVSDPELLSFLGL